MKAVLALLAGLLLLAAWPGTRLASAWRMEPVGAAGRAPAAQPADAVQARALAR
jgi:hypothetical protein